MGCRCVSEAVRIAVGSPDSLPVLVLVRRHGVAKAIRVRRRRSDSLPVLILVRSDSVAKAVRIRRRRSCRLSILVAMRTRRVPIAVGISGRSADIVLSVCCDGKYDRHQSHRKLFHNSLPFSYSKYFSFAKLFFFPIRSKEKTIASLVKVKNFVAYCK